MEHVCWFDSSLLRLKSQEQTYFVDESVDTEPKILNIGKEAYLKGLSDSLHVFAL